MLKNFVRIQWFNEEKGDWTEQVKKDLEDLEIEGDFKYFENANKEKFKNLIKEKCKMFAFRKYETDKEKHKKIKNLNYEDLKIQRYFLERNITTEQKRMIFRTRTHMERYKYNYKNQYKDLSCIVCDEHTDSQEESFKMCKGIPTQDDETDDNTRYEDLFEENIPIGIIKRLSRIRNIRENYQ